MQTKDTVPSLYVVHRAAVVPDLIRALRDMIDMATDGRTHGPEIARACAAIAKAESIR